MAKLAANLASPFDSIRFRSRALIRFAILAAVVYGFHVLVPAACPLGSQAIGTRYSLKVLSPTHAPIVDGNLSEWNETRFEKIPLDNRVVSDRLDPATGQRQTQVSLARGGKWTGASDLSGWIGLAVDPGALYLFGRILDDRIVPPPSMTPGDWNQGDAIEIFLDTDPRDRSPKTNEFSDDDYQIFLWPGHRDGPAWGVMRKGSLSGRDYGWVANDGAFEGVKVVFRRFADRETGYTFEARFPLLNFPYLTAIRHGYRIGFNVALGDREPGESGESADSSSWKYVYMTWNGKGDLYRNPDNYGELIVHDPTGRLTRGSQGSSRPDTGYLLLVVALLGALVLLAFLFTWIVRWIAGWSWSRKLWITGSLGLALAAVLALAPMVRLFSNRFVKERVAEAAQRTEELVSDCENLIPQSKLPDLLAGQTVDTRKDYDYRFFPVTDKVVQSSLPATGGAGSPARNTPAYLGDYTGVEVRRGRRTRFHLLPDELGNAMSVVISATRRRGVAPALSRPEPGRAVARLYLTQGDQETGPTPPTALYLDQGRALALEGPDRSLQPLRGFQPPGAQECTPSILYELQLDTSAIPASTRSPWFLTVEPLDDAYILTVHGLSVRKDEHWLAVPYRINTQVDLPFELVYRRSEPTVSASRRESSPVTIGEPLDRLWILFKCAHGYPHGSARDTRVADVVLRYADGQEDEIPLLSGVHLESHQSARKKLPAHMKVQVGLDDVWDEIDGLQKLTRRDVLTVPLHADRTTPLQSVFLRWHPDCDGPESVSIAAVTGGISRETSPVVTSERHPWLTSDDPGSIRLNADALQALSTFRISTSVIPVVTGLAPRQEGREVVSYVPLDNMNGLRLALELAPEGLIEGARKWTGVVLLIGLLPLLLVLAADGLGRTRRLRLKLFLAIGLVAMPPLALLVVYLDDKIKNEIERATETRARTATEQVVNAVNRNTQHVAALALELAQNRDLKALLENDAPARFDAQVSQRLATLETFLPERQRQEIHLLLWDGVLQRAHGSRPDQADLRFGWLLPYVDRSGLYDYYGEVVAVGFSPVRIRREEKRWSLCVLCPITSRFLESVLEDDPAVDAFAFLPGTGYPYAGIGPQGNDFQSAGARDARIMGLQAASAPDQTVIQHRPIGGADCTAGARILTDTMEEPILAVGAAVNRQTAFELRHTIRDSALVVGAAMLLLFVVITFLVTRRIIDPLVSLNQAARKLAKGEPDMPALPVHSLDEVGNLTAAFNDMASRLRRRLRGLELLNTGMGGLNARRTVDGVVETVAQVFEDTLHPHAIFLALHEPERGVFHILGGRQGGQPLRSRRIAAEGSFLLQAMNSGRPERVRALRWFDLARSESRLFHLQDGAPDEVVTVPLDYQGDPIGLLVLAYQDAPLDERPVDRESLMVLATMADQIAAALENARLYRLAVEDPLTGLFLQGYFEGRLKDEIQRASRHDRTLVLVRFRIEEVPIVATRFGPAGLNHLLRAVARHLRSVLEPDDLLAARLENNEFALALVEADRETGFEIAHRIAATLLSHPVAVGQGRPIKLSTRFGIAAFPADAGSFEFLLEAANRAMERADVLEADVKAGHLSSREPTLPPVFEEAGIVFKSPLSLELVRTVERIARSPMTVLITGETGTGKEVFAELIHRQSDRAGKPLIKVNCAALPELLLESELFGHERGAFTGAYKKKIGRFELANGGTLFLDEIGEISLSTQVKLLRVLQDKKIERLGGTESLALDVRIIAATNQEMLELIRRGRFREDLYYRLNVISLEVPPLRERKEEIPGLVDVFVRDFNREHGDAIAGVRPQTMDKLYNSSWPGNIRELKNVLERAMVSVDPGGYLEPHLLHLQDQQVRMSDAGAVSPVGAGPDAETSSLPRARSTAKPPREPGGLTESSSAPTPSSTELKSRQRDLLRYLETKRSITNQEYVAMMGISTRTGLRDLNQLIEMGLLQRVGNRRAATYKIKRSHDDTE